MPSLNSLISTARSSQSAGGERIYKSEAKKIAAQITRDSMVSAAEAKALRGILGDGNLTRSAEKLLVKTLELRGDSNDVAVATPSSSRPAAQPTWQLLISVETIH